MLIVKRLASVSPPRLLKRRTGQQNSAIVARPRFRVPPRQRLARFRSRQSAGALYLDPLRTETERGGYCFLHGPAEGNPPRKLERNILGYQLCIQFGPSDFLNIYVNLLSRECLEVPLELIYFGSLFADDDSGTGGMDIDLCLLPRPFDFNFGHARVHKPLFHDLAYLDILMQENGVIFLRIPPRVPRFYDPEPEPCRMYFLTHDASKLVLC